MISDAMVEAAYSTYCVKSGIFRSGVRDRMGLMAMRAALEAAEAVRERGDKLDKRPVAFRVKDFADGWIIYTDEAKAYAEAEATGALMQGLYVRSGGNRE